MTGKKTGTTNKNLIAVLLYTIAEIFETVKFILRQILCNYNSI